MFLVVFRCGFGVFGGFFSVFGCFWWVGVRFSSFLVVFGHFSTHFFGVFLGFQIE